MNQKDKKNNVNKYRTNKKNRVDLNPNMSVIALNINGLNILGKG